MKFPWMKDIVGEAYDDDMDAKVASALGTRFATLDNYNKVAASRDTLQEQLNTSNQALEQFQNIDPAKLNGKITELQQQLARTRLDSEINAAIIGAKAHNVEAVRALLGQELLDSVELQGDKLVGLDKALNKAVKDSPWAFDSQASGKTILPQGSPAPAGSSASDNDGLGSGASKTESFMNNMIAQSAQKGRLSINGDG